MKDERFERIRQSEYGDSPNNFHITRRGDVLSVELTYPNIIEKGVRFIEVDQESVRASDGIRLSYDYDRDGWVIQQPTKLCWDSEDTAGDMGWKEVAFIQSWALSDEQEAWERSLNGAADAAPPGEGR